MVDATDLKSVVRKGVRVRVPPSAPSGPTVLIAVIPRAGYFHNEALSAHQPLLFSKRCQPRCKIRLNLLSYAVAAADT